jgi:hypothetical protein
MSEATDPLQRPDSRPAGTVIPWPEIKRELPEMTGDEALVQKNWQEIDGWTYSFLWHCVVSF